MSSSKPTLPSLAEAGLQLLLARAEDHLPVLDQGLEVEALQATPRPTPLPGRVEVPTWQSADAGRNDLTAQRWGVIAPEGDVGDAILRAIAPLIAHREKEQGAPAKVYRVPADMDAARAVAWKDSVLQAEDVPEEERPWYLLILGDLHHVSLELQQVLAQGACVGRLHVGRPNGEPDLEGCAAYVTKLLARELRTEVKEAPNVLIYTARDGTLATTQGHQVLMEPCREAIGTRWKAKWPALELVDIPYDGSSPEELLRAVGQAQAGVMLSMAHGLGRPTQGWVSAEEQRARQGALSVGRAQALTGELMRHTPFLPGGMWFNVSCFGAATPAKSTFHAWVSRLAQEGAWSSPATSVLASLPGAGERPFLAALPQALLANEQGPLAIIGHSDLAWTLSFTDVENASSSRASRILAVLEVLAKGSRAGVAHAALMRHYQEDNDRLMANYQARADAQLYGHPDPTDPVRHGLLWMRRQDLRGYLLLGDPAARLAVKRGAP
ncbi:hypothetical protein [Hyalangium versicolor]|uniref:hypothetical protein n=1 Tax=Hyalangium versicolor TaxID=2861190 RepID=UPI001CCE43AE|nr:hypothetical protein [Hyalangium versicolor]